MCEIWGEEGGGGGRGMQACPQICIHVCMLLCGVKKES